MADEKQEQQSPAPGTSPDTGKKEAPNLSEILKPDGNDGVHDVGKAPKGSAPMTDRKSWMMNKLLAFLATNPKSEAIVSFFDKVLLPAALADANLEGMIDVWKKLLLSHPALVDETFKLYATESAKQAGEKNKLLNKELEDFREAWLKEYIKIIDAGISGKIGIRETKMEMAKMGVMFGTLLQGIGGLFNKPELVVMGQAMVARNFAEADQTGDEILKLNKLANEIKQSAPEKWREFVEARRQDMMYEAGEVIDTGAKISAIRYGDQIRRDAENTVKGGTVVTPLPVPAMAPRTDVGPATADPAAAAPAPASAPAPATGPVVAATAATKPPAAAAAAAPVTAPVAKGDEEQEKIYVKADDFNGFTFSEHNPGHIYSKNGKRLLSFRSDEEGIGKLRLSLNHNIADKNVTLGALIKKMYPASKTLLGKVSASTGIDKDAKLTTENIEPLIRGIITGLHKPERRVEAAPDNLGYASADGLANTNLAAVSSMPGRYDFLRKTHSAEGITFVADVVFPPTGPDLADNGTRGMTVAAVDPQEIQRQAEEKQSRRIAAAYPAPAPSTMT